VGVIDEISIALLLNPYLYFKYLSKNKLIYLNQKSSKLSTQPFTSMRKLLLIIMLFTISLCKAQFSNVTIYNLKNSVTFQTGYTKLYKQYGADSSLSGCASIFDSILFVGDTGAIVFDGGGYTQVDTGVFEIALTIKVSDSVIFKGTFGDLFYHQWAFKFKAPVLKFNEVTTSSGCDLYVDTIFINDQPIDYTWIYPRTFPKEVFTESIVIDSLYYNGKPAIYADSNIKYINVWISDTLYLYVSNWKNVTYSILEIGSEYLPSTSFNLDSIQLDSSNGLIKIPISSSTFAQGTTGAISLSSSDYLTSYRIDLNIQYNSTKTTSITTAYQQNKTGIVNIYDMQGNFVKQNPISYYTSGLQPNTIYIYNAIYSDNTTDKGKFVIQ